MEQRTERKNIEGVKSEMERTYCNIGGEKEDTLDPSHLVLLTRCLAALLLSRFVTSRVLQRILGINNIRLRQIFIPSIGNAVACRVEDLRL